MVDSPLGGKVDAADLKSAGTTRAGSSPAEGTSAFDTLEECYKIVDVVENLDATPMPREKEMPPFTCSIASLSTSRQSGIIVIFAYYYAEVLGYPTFDIFACETAESLQRMLPDLMGNKRYFQVEIR